MKEHILILLLLLVQFKLLADNEPKGGRAVASGDAFVAVSDIWSVRHNQAGLAGLDQASFGAYYENRFATNYLSIQGAAIMLPTNSGNFAIDLSRFGYQSYSENNIGFSYAKKLGERFDAGLRFSYFHISQIEYYGNAGQFIVEGGFRFKLTDKLTFGSHVYNFGNSNINNIDSEKLATRISLGVAYRFNPDLLLVFETENRTDFQMTYKGGVEFSFIENLWFRTGYISYQKQFSFGLGYDINAIQANLSFVLHPILGTISSLGLKYRFGKISIAETDNQQ